MLECFLFSILFFYYAQIKQIFLSHCDFCDGEIDVSLFCESCRNNFERPVFFLHITRLAAENLCQVIALIIESEACNPGGAAVPVLFQ